MLRLKPQKASKYHNKPIILDGIRFASKREGRRYTELKLLLRSGQISHLRTHTPWPLKGADGPLTADNGRVLVYVSDFDYLDADGNRVIEDTKGVRTAVYKLKKAIMRSMGYRIIEI